MGNLASILAIGDVHLGTRCSGIPDDVSTWGIQPEDLTPAAALKICTEFAIKKQMDAVLFAGDVVESTNARFEAMPHLEACVRQLLDAGIEVIAVAGNHDVEALPRLASLLDGFRLLGADGKWESWTLTKNQNPVAEIVGWSFNKRFVHQSPVAQLLSEPLDRPSTSIPRIGLLHADLNASGSSKYAPIKRHELDETGYDAWLLGHIHKPSYEGLSPQTGTRPLGYLGSLIGLDRSETGHHGPWIVRVGNGVGVQLEHVPLAPLRWEEIDISVAGIEHAEDVGERLLREAKMFTDRINQEGSVPRAIGLIARLTGSSSCFKEIVKWVAAGDWKDQGRVVDGTVVFYTRIIAAMTPHLDLAKIARGNDPAAIMAGRLLDLEQNNEQSIALLKEARTALAGVAHDDRWSVVNQHRNAVDPLSDTALRDILIRSGMTALNAMLSQKNPGDS